MAAAEVGRMSVRGVPDTKGFAKELKAQLAKIEKQAKVTITAALDASDVVSQAKAAAKAASGIATVVVETRIESAKLARQAVAAARDAGAAATVEIPVELERSGAFRAQVREMVALVERNAAELRIQAETAAARADADRLAADIADHKPEMQVGLDTAVAAARIAALTRDRFATIHARVSTSSLAGAATALTALSGLRLASNFSRGVRDMVMNLDQAIPRIAKTATLLGSLGNVAGSSAGLLLGVGASLSQIIGVLAVAPALLMGMGTGLGVLIAALLDTGDVLGDLGPQFTELQDSISGAFWGRAEAGVRNMVSAFMPLANHWLPRMAEELAVIPQAFGQIMQSELGQGALTKIFAYATGSVEDFAYGIYQAFAGFLRLGDAGAKYLPQMARWFGEIGNQFNAWAADFTASGRFDEWVTRAWDNLQALGSVLSSTIGILGAFASAAEAAGSPGLQGLADGLNVVEDALKGPVWQGALTEIFEGWNDGMARMMPGLGALADGFIALAPTIGEISRLAGEAASAVFGGLGAIAENPTFQKGLVDLFRGVRDGLSSVADVAPEIAEKLGKVMTVAGQMADVFGEVLETGIREFGPVLNDILDAAVALVPVLGGALIRAFEVIGPAIRPVVDAITDWAEENPDLAASLIAVAAGIGLAAVAASKLIGFLSPLVGVVRAIGGALGKLKMPKFLSGGAGGAGGLGGLAKTLGRVGSAASRLAGPIGFVIGLFASMWTNSEDLRGSVADLVESFLGFAEALGGAVMDAVRGVSDALENSGLMDAFKEAFDFFGDGAGILGDLAGVLIEWIADSFKVLTEFIEGDSAGVQAALNEMFSDAIEGLRGVLVDGFNWLWDLVKMTIMTKLQEISLGLLTWAQGLLEPVMAGFTNIYNAVLEFFSNLGENFNTGLEAVKLVWSLFWDGLTTKVTEWWTSVTTFLTEAWAQIQAAFTLGIEMVKLAWNTFWDGLLAKVTEAWLAVTTFLTEAWVWLQSVFTTGIELIKLAWNTFWDGLVTKVTEIWTTITTYVTMGWTLIQTAFNLGIELVKMIWNAFWDGLKQKVTDTWTGITTAVQTGIMFVQTAITGGLTIIGALWSAAWESIRQSASDAWSNIRSTVSTAITNVVTSIMTGAANMMSHMSNAWSNIQAGASAAWSIIKSTVTNAITNVVTSIITGAADMMARMSEAWSNIQSSASAAWENIKSTVTQAMVGLVAAIVTGAANVVSEFQNMATNALEALRSMVTNAASIGRDIVAGIVSGVASNAGSLISEMKGLASNALSAAKSALGIKSPSRVFRDQVGKWIPAGMAKGIDSAAHLAVKAAKRMADKAVKAAAPTKKAMTAAGKSVSGIWHKFVYSPSTTVKQGKSDWASKVMPKMAAAMTGKWGRIGRTSGAELARGLQGSVKQVAATAQKMRQAITKQLEMNRPKNAKGMAPVGTYYKKHYEQQVDSATSALKRLATQEAALKKQLSGLGSNAGKGMASGLREQITAVQAQAKRLSATLVATVRTQLGIHSPSRVMAELGRHTGEGFRIGVGHEAAAVQSALAAMVAPPSPVVPQAQADVTGGGEEGSADSLMLELLVRIAEATEAGKNLDGHQLIRGLRSTKRAARDTQPI